jgi:hypothetical protein
LASLSIAITLSRRRPRRARSAGEGRARPSISIVTAIEAFGAVPLNGAEHAQGKALIGIGLSSASRRASEVLVLASVVVGCALPLGAV